MTQDSKGSYGVQWPKWYVYWRGRWWLSWGCCPNCYSSPPNPACKVCEGSYEYSYRITPDLKSNWLMRWNHWRGKS